MKHNEWYPLSSFKYEEVSYVTYIKLLKTSETEHEFEYKTEQMPVELISDEMNNKYEFSSAK